MSILLFNSVFILLSVYGFFSGVRFILCFGWFILLLSYVLNIELLLIVVIINCFIFFVLVWLSLFLDECNLSFVLLYCWLLSLVLMRWLVNCDNKLCWFGVLKFIE